MQRQTGICLYNVIFPIWMLILFPIGWLIAIPGNFLIDSLVLLLLMRNMQRAERNNIYRKSIWRVYGIGFLSDFIGLLWMFGSQVIDGMLGGHAGFGAWWYQHITNAVALNPFETIPAFVYTFLGVAISGLCIYALNVRFAFSKTRLQPRKKKQFALWLAVCTAPYLFFLPTIWFL